MRGIGDRRRDWILGSRSSGIGEVLVGEKNALDLNRLAFINLGLKMLYVVIVLSEILEIFNE
jgi:hypothetical protein